MEATATARDFADAENDDDIRNAFGRAREQVDEGPRPLYRALPTASPFPVDAMGPVLANATKAIERMIQCPLACAANSVLSVASLAAQGRANAVLPIGQGKTSPLSLFLLTVLDSGERKSSADSMALKPVRDYEQELAELDAGERMRFAAKSEAHAVTAAAIKKKKIEQAAIEAALMDLGPAPQPPLLSVIAPSSDPTWEGMFRVYQHGRPSLAMLCDDAATFLGSHSMKAEQKVSTTANLCRAWDGAKIERIRSGDGVNILHNRRLALHMMIQPGVAAEFLSDRQFADQGLLARFLVSAPTGRAGTRFRDDAQYQADTRAAAADLEAYNGAVMALLRSPIRWKNEEDRALGVELDQLDFTPAARALYVDFANAIEQEMGPKGALATAKAFASKLPEQAARIAGVLVLMEDAGASSIEEHTLGAAIKLAKFYLSETMRLIATGAVDLTLYQAEQLREWLMAQPGDAIGLRSIYQFGPNGIRQASKAREAMSVLADHGWCEPLKDGAEIDGKHCREAWRIIRC